MIIRTTTATGARRTITGGALAVLGSLACATTAAATTPTGPADSVAGPVPQCAPSDADRADQSAVTTDGTDTAPGATVEIVDAQDRTVEVPVDPDVVVVTDWSVIRTLADLCIVVDAVPAPNSALPSDLAAYEGDDVAKVGDVFEPDYEAIEAMEPDLVIVGSRSGTPEVVAELENFAPAVVDLSVRNETPEELLPLLEERVLQLGQIFGVEAEAQALMDDLDAQIGELSEQIAARAETAMFVQVSDGTVNAYGPGSRFGLVYELFGYQPTDAPLDEEGSHGQEISQEFFVQYDPDVLFVLDRAKAVGQEQTPALDILNDGLVGSTAAAENDRIVEVDGFSWYLASAAPSSLQRMIDDVKASR